MRVVLGIIFLLMVFVLWFNQTTVDYKLDVETFRKMKLSGVITRMYKKEGDKCYTIEFINNVEIRLPYPAPTNNLEPGDSVFKDSNSFEYIFFIRPYKPERPADTIVFKRMVDGRFIY